MKRSYLIVLVVILLVGTSFFLIRVFSRDMDLLNSCLDQLNGEEAWGVVEDESTTLEEKCRAMKEPNEQVLFCMDSVQENSILPFIVALNREASGFDRENR